MEDIQIEKAKAQVDDLVSRAKKADILEQENILLKEELSKKPTINPYVTVENPPVQGSSFLEYAKPASGFIGLSLLGGFLTGVGRDVADLFLHSPTKDRIIIQDDRKKDDEEKIHPQQVLVNQITLHQRQTTSRPVQRRRK